MNVKICGISMHTVICIQTFTIEWCCPWRFDTFQFKITVYLQKCDTASCRFSLSSVCYCLSFRSCHFQAVIRSVLSIVTCSTEVFIFEVSIKIVCFWYSSADKNVCSNTKVSVWFFCSLIFLFWCQHISQTDCIKCSQSLSDAVEHTRTNMVTDTPNIIFILLHKRFIYYDVFSQIMAHYILSNQMSFPFFLIILWIICFYF